MTTFGDVLRGFRQAGNDPDRLNRRLTQERLGQLIGHEMGDFGFSGAAVSDWERNKSRISADDRIVLTSLIKVLHKCGGVKNLAEANQLLEAGNYRVLNADETQLIFGYITNGMVDDEDKTFSSLTSFLIENIFGVSQTELGRMVKGAKDGPSPSWPRILAAFMRRFTDRFSISLVTIVWVWIWLFSWWLIGSSLQWPFANQGIALISLGKYIAGSLIIPLLIGLLVNTDNNDYWQHNKHANPILLRMYTYQGAGIGLNLGYFFVFPLSLIRYYLNLEHTIWVEIAAVTLGMVFGNMAARVVPHNLWLAYGWLTLKDGGIFFIVALVGPLWGFFFMEYYSILLIPLLGTIIILSAVTIVVIISTRRAKSRADNDLPPRN